MNQILGIMRDDHFKRDAVLFLVKSDVLVNPVEAIGFRGGTIVRAHCHVDVVKTL